MKQIKFLITASIFITVMAGCKKVLDVEPQTSFTDVSVFTSKERLELAMNGVYDAAQSGFYVNTDNSNATRGYPFGAAGIQQADVRGEDVISIAAFYNVTYQNSYNATSPNNVNMWANLYHLINRANVMIEGVRGVSGTVVSAAEANSYEAESKFLRALAHHELLIYFARPYRDNNGQNIGVPYRDVAINTASKVVEARNTPRMRVDSVYKNILEDLDYAEANLSATKNTIRATKGAAIALKMRVKLHMGDWAGVITEGNKLVSASAPFKSPIGGYELTASPDGPFTNNNSVENIFSIKNDALDNGGNNGALANMYGAASVGARGLIAISPIIWNNDMWKCDDKRRTLLNITGANANGSTTVNVFTTKYRDYTNRNDYAPIIRYAEVLLTLAEAEARQASGVSARAVELLNAVRNRALASPADAYTAGSFAGKNALIAAILFERRVEFLAEGKRWGDIHRNAPDPDFTTGGIPAKVATGTQGASLYSCGGTVTATQAAIPYSDFKFIWPIPAAEITQNPIITQNPGY